MEKETKSTLPKQEVTEKKSAPKPKAAKETAPVLESKTTVEKTVNSKPQLASEEPKKAPKKALKMSKDASETRNIAWLAYILFFIPLLINKTSPFVRHHANEGLEINIFDAIGAVLLILGAVVKTSIAWLQLLMIIFTVIGFVLIVLTTVTKLYMIFSTLRGKSVSTPWMWNLRIIK